jgi:RNAse (barnase) inhibitor barstar
MIWSPKVGGIFKLTAIFLVKLLSMHKLAITIEGDNFSDLESFFDEMDKVLTKELDWEPGRNLNAFNDMLRGGFWVFEYEEPIKIVWTNFAKSKESMGEELVEELVGIISEHDHIEFLKID